MSGPPGFLRQIADDTRALLADLRAAGRRLTTRWQWLRLKSRRRMDDAAGRIENVRRSAETRSRMCSGCRALIPIDARVCPECGAAPGRPVPAGLMRLVQNAAPGVVSASSLILTLTMLIYALTWVVYSRLGGASTPRMDYWGFALYVLGANSGDLVISGEPWRLLTSVFLHGNLLHLGFNCYALMTVGPLIEEIYGYRKFLVFYLVTGFAGSATSAWWHFPQMLGVGASGAIFGLIGVAAVWGRRRGGTIGSGIQGLMVQWALYGLVMGLLLKADNAAHLGGLASGALLGFVVEDQEPRSVAGARIWELLAYLCMLLVAASFIMVAINYGPTLERIESS
ncbi:MAG TPA: rhomboid family intramembrane serine protease [Candidatus Polarisedimenticolia bacterium]